jgi:membrane associated rhomboid family serine protease
VFVPIYDENPLRKITFQWMTLTIIAANVAIYLLMSLGGGGMGALSFAVVPVEFLDEGLLGQPTYRHRFNVIDIRERWTLLSYMFMHGSLLHLASNMVFVWVFGDNVEDALGHWLFLAFYLACGACAALLHIWFMPGSEAPLIGASGATSGIVAAYLVLFPRVRLWVLFLPFIPLRLTALLALGAWVLLQFIMPFLPSSAPIAWWAHVGGVIAGGVLIMLLTRFGGTSAPA